MNKNGLSKEGKKERKEREKNSVPHVAITTAS